MVSEAMMAGRSGCSSRASTATRGLGGPAPCPPACPSPLGPPKSASASSHTVHGLEDEIYSGKCHTQ